MTVIALASKAAQAGTTLVPCRSNDADLWFAEDQASTDRAQSLCRKCPLQTECLAGALARKEACGVWGGELFADGQIVAGHKPKGRPRKDAQQVAAAAAAEVATRLTDVSDVFADTEPDLADLLAQAATEVAGAA